MSSEMCFCFTLAFKKKKMDINIDDFGKSFKIFKLQSVKHMLKLFNICVLQLL